LALWFENQHEGEKKKKDLMYAKERFIVATNLNHVNLV